jgi:hypothetical protein
MVWVSKKVSSGRILLLLTCEDDEIGRCLLGCCAQLRVEVFGMRTQGRADVDGLNAEDEGQRGGDEEEAVGWGDGEHNWGSCCTVRNINPQTGGFEMQCLIFQGLFLSRLPRRLF